MLCAQPVFTDALLYLGGGRVVQDAPSQKSQDAASCVLL